ncbi:cyclophilin-like fold protein [Pantoea osteomyelitidis]|uniref:Cyclophilin-like fold protein n=1 Tax=Pantoea osteomyelitidis TaxID=3230026 RepID=A0ABW7Q155_9GAMM
MRIKIHVDGKTLLATLNDSEASRDFASMMPLTLQLKDYAGAEKISDLPARLSTSGSPNGSSASKGDLCLYAPWGNLAIFYKKQSYAPGLVKLGHLDAPETFPFNEKAMSAIFEKAD